MSVPNRYQSTQGTKQMQSKRKTGVGILSVSRPPSVGVPFLCLCDTSATSQSWSHVISDISDNMARGHLCIFPDKHHHPFSTLQCDSNQRGGLHITLLD